MITKWGVSNFKSIRENTELDFGPLTIFAGANSSGKSTFIQSVLLVAQTLAHKVSSRSVVLNGSLASLGQFDDLKSSDGEIDQISIKFTCCPIPKKDEISDRRSSSRRTFLDTSYLDRLQEIECGMYFDADPSSPERDLFQIQPRLFATHLSCVSRDEDNLDEKAYVKIRHLNRDIVKIEGLDDVSSIDDQVRTNLAYGIELDDNSMAEVREEYESAKPIGCMLKHFLPKQIIYQIDTIAEDANAITTALRYDRWMRRTGFRRNGARSFPLSKEIIAILQDVLEGIINLNKMLAPKNNTLWEWRQALRDLPVIERVKIQQALQEQEDLFDRIHAVMKMYLVKESKHHALVHERPSRLITQATRYLDDFFASSLKYLGPLRDAPKPLYPLAPAADPYDVGLRGEHTASILELHKNKRIQYISSKNFKPDRIERKPITRTLETAVIDWLKYLGIANSVKSHDKGKLGHELKVELANSDTAHDLTHVGVGVSQVLPILVMCLLAEPDSTLVFEQPELHLHPKVQTLLGDFFLSMALCNKQCIVETHSEHFIDRLRFRIAAASPEAELNNKAKIYFVEKKSQTSSFREVVINEYGAISDWPEGFFDQSHEQAEKILHAAMMKRKASKENKHE